MPSMNISLPQALKAYVDAQVEARGYGTSSEFVRDLIRKDQDAQRQRTAARSTQANRIERDNDPMTTALSVVSTSIRKPVADTDLIRALQGADGGKSIVEIFFADVGERTIAAMVDRGYFKWSELEAAMKGRRGIGDEKASFIREMAVYELASAAGDRAAPAR